MPLHSSVRQSENGGLPTCLWRGPSFWDRGADDSVHARQDSCISSVMKSSQRVSLHGLVTAWLRVHVFFRGKLITVRRSSFFFVAFVLWVGVSPVTGRLTWSVFKQSRRPCLQLNIGTTHCEAEKLLRLYFRTACLTHFPCHNVDAGAGRDRPTGELITNWSRSTAIRNLDANTGKIMERRMSGI